MSFTISWSLLKPMSIESVMPCNHLILCCSLLLLPSIFPATESFPMSHFFESGGQSVGVSASAPVLPMNIWDCFPLGLTGLISLHSKGFSRVVSNTTVGRHQFFGTSLPYSPTLTSIHDYWKNCSFDYTDLCQQRGDNLMDLLRSLVSICIQFQSFLNPFYLISLFKYVRHLHRSEVRHPQRSLTSTLTPLHCSSPTPYGKLFHYYLG